MTPKLKTLLSRFYGDAEGPFGFRMPSTIATEVDSILKGLPKECRDVGFMRATYIPKSIDFVDGERSDISFVTTNSVDRDNEIVLASGGNWKQFQKNPVVPFGHDYTELPIGRCEWVARDNTKGMDGWKAKTAYMPRPDTHPAEAEWFPDTVYSYVKEGFMPGKSIGFIPMSMRAVSAVEMKADPSWKRVKSVIDKWMALEYSVVPVQSNPDALVVIVSKARQKGIRMSPEFFERIGLVLPESILSFDDLDTKMNGNHDEAGRFASDGSSGPRTSAEAKAAENASTVVEHRAAAKYHDKVVADLYKSTDSSGHFADDMNFSGGTPLQHNAAAGAHRMAADAIKGGYASALGHSQNARNYSYRANHNVERTDVLPGSGFTGRGQRDPSQRMSPSFRVINTPDTKQQALAAAQKLLMNLNPSSIVEQALNKHRGRLS